ncbi:amidohydrolase family-domain-containing protein [Lentinula edodes]|nr:amidohydrolase family-domain-containing protein [Lentinula edodes]KAJ3901408.1 amidohydrolase family-domain-containing protein [Lentinula edodes]
MVASNYFLDRSMQFLVVALSVAAFFLFRGGLEWQSSTSYVLCSPEDTEKIYTVDNANSRVQCMLINNAVITHTGSLAQVQQQWQDSNAGFFGKYRALPSVRYIQPGAIVVPGLTDSHVHILEYGATLQLPLEGTKTVNETVARVRNYILSNADIHSDKSKFVLGGGWDHTFWPSGAWPTAEDLESDPVIRGRPVVLQSKDCHALWLSQKALESSLPFPQEVDGGLIVRDASGKPTGMLLDNAQELVKQPKLLEDDLLRRFDSAIQNAVKFGLTSIHDAGLDPASLKFFKQEARRRILPIRIYGMSYFDENGEYWGNTTQPLIATGGERLTARSVKIFADGALRTGGAALYEPYADNSITNGLMRIDKDVLFKYIPLFLRDGWQVNVHAIGDRANGLVVDAFEASLNGVNVTALRPRLEHAQLMTKADMHRVGKLGVIASVQPTHAISDMLFAEDRLGPERVKNLYAFRTLIESGARITLGSDAPVEDLNPLAGFYAAITRLTPDGDSPHGTDGWFPEQRLTREEALRGMTIDPAYASFTESILGSLEVGKRADFVVFSQDIMTIPVPEILSTKVLGTAVDGKLVYGAI